MDVVSSRVKLFLQFLLQWLFVISGAFIGVLQGLYLGTRELIQAYLNQLANQDTKQHVESVDQQLVGSPQTAMLDPSLCNDVDSAFDNQTEEIQQKEADESIVVPSLKIEEQSSSQQQEEQDYSQLSPKSDQVVQLLEDVWLGSPEKKKKKSKKNKKKTKSTIQSTLINSNSWGPTKSLEKI